MEKIGIYPDIFDLFTVAHASIVEQALKVLDKVVIVIQPVHCRSRISSVEYKKSAQLYKHYITNQRVTVVIQEPAVEDVRDVAKEQGAQYVIHDMTDNQAYNTLCADIEMDDGLTPLFFMPEESVRKYTGGNVYKLHSHYMDMDKIVIAGELTEITHYSNESC